ncbi:MAG: TolC family protein, partial [Bacteroidaceae bacterium]|nr:TolC family protein [Bacteroidaceae bacterium]
NQLACHYEREKYAAGKSTLYVLSQAQQKLIAARNDVVQARCELALRLRILKYYD